MGGCRYCAAGRGAGEGGEIRRTNILRDVAQYPEERSSDWQNVAVARRKALRGSVSLAIQR
jgi:hypothetical protein